MRTAEFDYRLPERAIGQPPPRRDASRMLVLQRSSGRIAHRTVRDLPELLAPGDVVVINETKVFRARLRVTVNGKPAECCLVRPDGAEWIVLGKPGKRFALDARVEAGKLRGVIRQCADDGSLRIAFGRTPAQVIAYANRIGDVPTPPYIAGSVRRLGEYQTAYARYVGSVAAPTAGFHLTPHLLRRLRTKGVHLIRVTLHVGLGTFQPIRADDLDAHVMHAEWVAVPAAAVRMIAAARERGGRIFAVGTTTLRALEGTAMRHGGTLMPYRGFVDCFITPGYRFHVVDALLTNFHLPKSSLLVLVAAFVAPGACDLRGRDVILRAYRSALRRGYRFYSFGDAMLMQ